MKSSEKTLLIILVGTLSVFVVIPAVWKSFSAPIQEQQEKLNTKTDELDKATSTVALSMSKVRRMTAFKERSLSSNALQGANAYQQWLTDLAEIVAGFRNPSVSTERVALSRDRLFSTIRVRIGGEGTAEQLQEFLFRFHRASLLHRIVGMSIEALDNSARPRLALKITAEAVSLSSAGLKGPTLFPRTTVVSLDGPRLTVQSAAGFPESDPFEIRVGSEYVTVSKAAGTVWTLELTDGRTLSASQNDVVELSPVHEDFADATLADFSTFVEQNPFAKPAPYAPRIDLTGSKTVERGSTLEATLVTTGFPPGDSSVTYAFASDAPPGMQLNGDRLTWTPASDAPAGDQSVTLRASGGGLREPVEAEFTLTLKDVNSPPVLTLASTDRLSVTIGQTATFRVTATDRETPAEELKLAVGPDAPEGAAFDESTKTFRFTPASGTEIGVVEIPVQVTDGGETPQTTTLTVSVTVEDDRARFTVFTGMVAADSDRQIWLRDQSTNRKIVLRKGQRLQYAGFDAEILDIGRDFFTFRQKTDTLKLQLGQALRDATVIAQQEASATRADAHASPSAAPPARPEPAEPAPSSDSPSPDGKPAPEPEPTPEPEPAAKP